MLSQYMQLLSTSPAQQKELKEKYQSKKVNYTKKYKGWLIPEE